MLLKRQRPHVIPQILVMLPIVASYFILQRSCLYCQDHLLYTYQTLFREATILLKQSFPAPDPLQPAQPCSVLCRHSQSMATCHLQRYNACCHCCQNDAPESSQLQVPVTSYNTLQLFLLLLQVSRFTHNVQQEKLLYPCLIYGEVNVSQWYALPTLKEK